MFPYIGVSVFPEKGDGIYFINLFRRNEPDHYLTHKACPIILGAKWICNKWIGYDAQWKEEHQHCGIDKEARFYPVLQNALL